MLVRRVRYSNIRIHNGGYINEIGVSLGLLVCRSPPRFVVQSWRPVCISIVRFFPKSCGTWNKARAHELFPFRFIRVQRILLGQLGLCSTSRRPDTAGVLHLKTGWSLRNSSTNIVERVVPRALFFTKVVRGVPFATLGTQLKPCYPVTRNRVRDWLWEKTSQSCCNGLLVKASKNKSPLRCSAPNFACFRRDANDIWARAHRTYKIPLHLREALVNFSGYQFLAFWVGVKILNDEM